MQTWPNPFIEQRADPYILRHDGQYYFIASVPEYDRLAIRRADSLEGLRDAEEVVVWRKPDTGPMSQLIWVHLFCRHAYPGARSARDVPASHVCH